MEFISNLWSKLLIFNKRDEAETDETEEAAADSAIARFAKRRFSCSGRISGASQLSRRRHSLYDCNAKEGPDIVDDAREIIRDGLKSLRRRSFAEPKVTPISKQKRKQSLYDYYSTRNARVAEEMTENRGNYGRRRSVSDSGVLSTLGQARKSFLYNISIGDNVTRDKDEKGETMEDAIRYGRRRSLSGGAVFTSHEQTRKIYFTGRDQTRHSDHRRDEFYRQQQSTVGMDSFVENRAVEESEDESILDIVKEKLFRPEKRRSELVSETVARKLAERKKELKTLTRRQTITYMKIKHDL